MLWDDFNCDVKSFMTFMVKLTVAWNKSAPFIGCLPIRQALPV